MRCKRLMGATIAVVLGASAVAGCGSDDDGDASGSEGDTTEFVATGSDEQQIEQVLVGIQKDYDNVDGAAYCAKVTEKEQRDIVGFGRNFGRGTTCINVINRVARETRAAGVVQKPTRFISARVNGNRARVRVKNGPRKPEWEIFVKEDGDWKMVDSGFDPDPVGAILKEQQQSK
jgi:hypothetical protein